MLWGSWASNVSVDECLVLRDGTLVSMDECLVLRDGTQVSMDECLVPRDGTLVSVDECLVLRDGTLVSVDECLVARDGTSVRADGSPGNVDVARDGPERTVFVSDSNGVYRERPMGWGRLRAREIALTATHVQNASVGPVSSRSARIGPLTVLDHCAVAYWQTDAAIHATAAKKAKRRASP
jgi:hypothetical protein